MRDVIYNVNRYSTLYVENIPKLTFLRLVPFFAKNDFSGTIPRHALLENIVRYRDSDFTVA